VSQSQLAKSLETVVEDCVNAVGVDVNMASVALLAKFLVCQPTWPKTSCAIAIRTARFVIDKL